jgi:hypothetical protein
MRLLGLRTLFAMHSTGNPARSARVLIHGAVRPDPAVLRGTDLNVKRSLQAIPPVEE